MSDNKSYGVIYCAMLPNGKRYIGQTIKTLERRIVEHRCATKYEVDRYFYRALKKYGFENAVWTVLQECYSKEELDEAEIRYITEYKTMYNENGYNIKEGGSYGRQPEELKRQLSESRRGANNPMYGKTGWSKGKTKKTDERVAKFAKTRLDRIAAGEISPGAVYEGSVPWNKGKTGYKVGRRQKRNYTNCKLREKDVLDIIERLELGESGPSIAKLYNVGTSAIYSIKYGRTWKELKQDKDNNENE